MTPTGTRAFPLCQFLGFGSPPELIAFGSGLTPNSRQARDGGEEGLRVGVLGRGEDLGSEACLDEAARLHDGDSGGELRDHGDAVRNQKQREGEFALELFEEFENLRADRDVEGGDGFVGDDKFLYRVKEKPAPFAQNAKSGTRRHIEHEFLMCGSILIN